LQILFSFYFLLLLSSSSLTIVCPHLGQKAQTLFAQNNIEVVFGVDADEPTALVEKYISNDLESGSNQCDH